MTLFYCVDTTSGSPPAFIPIYYYLRSISSGRFLVNELVYYISATPSKATKLKGPNGLELVGGERTVGMGSGC